MRLIQTYNQKPAKATRTTKVVEGLEFLNFEPIIDPVCTF